MRLNVQTDYALRQLMYLAVNSERLCTIREIADYFEISNNHMIKVAYLTGKAGFVHSVRGRSGGLKLKLPAKQIIIGDVVRSIEADFAVAECHQGGKCNKCVITPSCKLKNVLNNAVLAFLAVLDDYSIADLVEGNDDLKQLLFQEIA